MDRWEYNIKIDIKEIPVNIFMEPERWLAL
jgi:hypothetical protein